MNRSACLAAGAALVVAACAAPEGSGLDRLVAGAPVVLLGEVHDNAAQHALRLSAFEALLDAGARPALLMEQFDRERQPAIDRARADPAADADAVIAAGGDASSGWNWDFYRPFVALALRHRLPIVAANVSRSDARRVIADGLAASGFDAVVPDDVLRAHARDIEAAHCGLVDAATARRMAFAQVARDQFIAKTIEAHAARGAVLLAGNGHVRADVGVPRWLDPATRARTRAIGVLEAGDRSAALYDAAVETPRAPRPDPCRGMTR